MSNEYCLECDTPLLANPVIALEQYDGELLRSATLAHMRICPTCMPTNALIVRHIVACMPRFPWPTHFAIVRESGHRSPPIALFSIFPFMKKEAAHA